MQRIYRHILKYNKKIEWIGGNNKYRLIGYYNSGSRAVSIEYKGNRLHGRYQGWFEDGTKYWDELWDDGKNLGRII